jgi:RNA polymerase sigma-70 factor (ECF subfamily)
MIDSRRAASVLSGGAMARRRPDRSGSPGTRMRDIAPEVPLFRDPMPQAGSAALASMLPGRLTSPSNATIRAEQIVQVQEAIISLDPLDREVVAQGRFE